MRTRNSILLAALIMATVTLFTYTDAGAFANGDNSCSTAEKAVLDCGVFGKDVIEYVGSSSGKCPVGGPSNDTPTSCTVYFYRYTGSGTVNTGIPKTVHTQFQAPADAAEAGCNPLVTNGTGASTGFLKNDHTQNVCAIIANSVPCIGASCPTNLNPPAPGTANFFVAADPSFSDERPWQVLSGRKVFAAEINGPALLQPTVFEGGATILASDGTSCTYQVTGNQIILTNCVGGSVVPQEDTKFCCKLGTSTCSGPTTFTNPAGNWHCETIDFATEQCDIKTTGTDPWRYIGGKWVLIP